MEKDQPFDIRRTSRHPFRHLLFIFFISNIKIVASLGGSPVAYVVLVNYDSTVIITSKLLIFMTLES